MKAMPLNGRDPYLHVVDPRRTSYDTRRALLSLIVTFVAAAVVFGAFYYFSPRAPEVPTGPAVEQPIDQTPPENAPAQVPTAP